MPVQPQVHVDLALGTLIGVPRAVAGNAESLPLQQGAFSTAICVGSVLNYCDAARLIFEAVRMLRPGGRFILEFESSDSVEYIATPHFRESSTLAEVTLRGEKQLIWLYSQRYIRSLLTQAGFKIHSTTPFHILSAIAHRISGDQEASARWAHWDPIMRRFPPLRTIAANFILSCEKS